MNEKDLIDTQELKAKLDRGDGFKVVMTLGEWEYRTTRIPGPSSMTSTVTTLSAVKARSVSSPWPAMASIALSIRLVHT